MNVEGRCHCGRIRYEATVEPEQVTICHCTDCQMLSGSAYRASVPAPSKTFVLTGTPRIYVKTADSGNQRAHAFCPDCGTPVYSAAIRDPAQYSLRVGCLAQRDQLRPTRQIWCKSALPWSTSLQGIAEVSGQ